MPKRVLIVDDEENIVISIEFLMRQAGYDIEIARDGEEAMAKIKSFQPDLILLDVMMPKTNGFEVCRRIREQSRLNDLKIVMLTAKGREAEVTKGLALGADSYIIKPFSTRELMSEVKKHLE
jgi:DNA-binding response OmpR family regulator